MASIQKWRVVDANIARGVCCNYKQNAPKSNRELKSLSRCAILLLLLHKHRD